MVVPKDRFFPSSPGSGCKHLGRIKKAKVTTNRDYQVSIASALGMNLDQKFLDFSSPSSSSEWATPDIKNRLRQQVHRPRSGCSVSTDIVVKKLQFHNIIDDFYNTAIALSTLSEHLAVATGNEVTIWTEREGGILPALPPGGALISCLGFSPDNVLAIGRKDGSITLYSIAKQSIVGVYNHSHGSVCSVLWYPRGNNDLFIGDTQGSVTHISFQPEQQPGTVRIALIKSVLRFHKEQICGLAVSPDLRDLAVGGNDNMVTVWDISDLPAPVLKFQIHHNAAVKALAFCPWTPGLLATGGGAHDRTIRSGALLQTITLQGQITSIVWSLHCRQLCVTFGFNTADTLLSVYSYPKMDLLATIPSEYPGRVISACASREGDQVYLGTSDGFVRLCDVWTPKRHLTVIPQAGIYRSDIIDMMEGIDKGGLMIR